MPAEGGLINAVPNTDPMDLDALIHDMIVGQDMALTTYDKARARAI